MGGRYCFLTIGGGGGFSGRAGLDGEQPILVSAIVEMVEFNCDRGQVEKISEKHLRGDSEDERDYKAVTSFSLSEQ